MKKVIFVLLLMISTGLMAQSQQAPARAMRADGEKRIQMMIEELGLSKEQAQQVRTLQQQFKDDRHAAKEGDKSDRQAVKEKFEAELKQILTPEQFEKFEAMREERKAEMKEKRQEHKAPRK